MHTKKRKTKKKQKVQKKEEIENTKQKIEYGSKKGKLYIQK